MCGRGGGERGWRVRKASSPNAAKGGGGGERERERERERESVFDPLNHLSPLRKKVAFSMCGGVPPPSADGSGEKRAEVEQDGDPVPLPEEHKCSFPKGQFRNDSSLFNTMYACNKNTLNTPRSWTCTRSPLATTAARRKWLKKMAKAIVRKRMLFARKKMGKTFIADRAFFRETHKCPYDTDGSRNCYCFPKLAPFELHRGFGYSSFASLQTAKAASIPLANPFLPSQAPREVGGGGRGGWRLV